MKKRMVSSLLAVAMITTLLGGCGTKQGETTKTEQAVAETEKTEGNTDAAKESEVLAGGTEVEAVLLVSNQPGIRGQLVCNDGSEI